MPCEIVEVDRLFLSAERLADRVGSVGDGIRSRLEYALGLARGVIFGGAGAVTELLGGRLLALCGKWLVLTLDREMKGGN